MHCTGQCRYYTVDRIVVAVFILSRGFFYLYLQLWRQRQNNPVSSGTDSISDIRPECVCVTQGGAELSSWSAGLGYRTKLDAFDPVICLFLWYRI